MAFDAGLAERVRTLLASRDGVSERRMFGCAVFMIHGNMCCGVLKTGLFLRCSSDGTDDARPHTRSMEMGSRRMKGMILIEPEGTTDDADLERWVGRAYARTRALPWK